MLYINLNKISELSVAFLLENLGGHSFRKYLPSDVFDVLFWPRDLLANQEPV